MCGIVGYIGQRNAIPLTINGLKKLEYRGYDSAGISFIDNDLKTFKTKGKVKDLEKILKSHKKSFPNIAIAHTRWATHGIPSDINSHPHISNSGRLALIHNGIIENYSSLKKLLTYNGFTFKSETDSEVLVNLIEHLQTSLNLKVGKAVQVALSKVVGAYAICVIDITRPFEMIVAKLGSPLAVGIGCDEFFVGSDASPFVEFTNRSVYLEDNEVAIINIQKSSFKLFSINDGTELTPKVQELDYNLEQIEKGGYDYFMLKEIFEQPRAIHDTIRGRLNITEKTIKLSGIEENLEKFKNVERIIIVACGTSWHAGLVAEYIFEDLCRIPTEVEYASEFRFRNPVINKNDLIISISQSGETADTLAAVKMAKKMGAFIFGICNVVGSSIAREVHSGAFTHAGPEIGVASTKAFTTQIALLTLIGLRISQIKKSLNDKIFKKLINSLNNITILSKEVLKLDSIIYDISKKYYNAPNFLFLGRGCNFPTALEGALKLKEISYIHAEGYPAAEMKHGPIALVDKNMPVVVIATKKGFYEKVVSNIQEIKSREGKIISIVTEGDTDVKKLSDDYIEIPECEELLVPILASIPLQLLSYHIALLRGCNVDQPRNLAKSVTVE
ncbi:MAG: glutamine--fructose-6-phosphate transaminase (isomerizing) [Bacteroidota bacterium]|nr:glutamine--fructose-6-phosphate transaminase (isomerizing) [Bacteroidota bacterium]